LVIIVMNSGLWCSGI